MFIMPHLPSLESLWFGFTLTMFPQVHAGATGCLERTNNPVGLSASKIWIPQGHHNLKHTQLYTGISSSSTTLTVAIRTWFCEGDQIFLTSTKSCPLTFIVHTWPNYSLSMFIGFSFSYLLNNIYNQQYMLLIYITCSTSLHWDPTQPERPYSCLIYLAATSITPPS